MKIPLRRIKCFFRKILSSANWQTFQIIFWSLKNASIQIKKRPFCEIISFDKHSTAYRYFHQFWKKNIFPQKTYFSKKTQKIERFEKSYYSSCILRRIGRWKSFNVRTNSTGDAARTIGKKTIKKTHRFQGVIFLQYYIYGRKHTRRPASSGIIFAQLQIFWSTFAHG